MAGRTAIVTGGTSGLGHGCVRAILELDPSWHVVLAVRDVERGRAVATELGQPERCTVISLDLASLASVARCVDECRTASIPPIEAVVCNAGLQVISETRLTEDGIEMTFGVNHLGHFALVTGLLEQLSRPSRVVVVSSDTHDATRSTGMPAPRYTTAEQLAHPARGDDTPGRCRYTTSKLCNVLFAYELDRRHRDDGISASAFNPGLMPGSGLARDYSGIQQLAWRYVMPVLRILPQVRSTKQSGRHLAALAADRRHAGISGVYFDGLKQIRSSPDSYDRDKATDLWETSERLIAIDAGS
jgi:NAD(P)-dependent dehydrogenase (short-subunit alcohol dehydrogenase family)